MHTRYINSKLVIIKIYQQFVKMDNKIVFEIQSSKQNPIFLCSMVFEDVSLVEFISSHARWSYRR